MVKVLPLIICFAALGVGLYFAFFWASDEDGKSGIENCPLFKKGGVEKPAGHAHGGDAADCPFLKKQPHIAPGMKLSTCPMMKNSKCPYVKEHKSGKCVCDLDGAKCPHLGSIKGGEKGKCPYYDESQIHEAVNGKCKYMQKLQDEGKTESCPCSDFRKPKDDNKCAFLSKHPELKSQNAKDCPKLGSKCSFFNKHSGSAGDSCPCQTTDIEKCPHLSKQKETLGDKTGKCPYFSDEELKKYEHSGCPNLKDKKCPCPRGQKKQEEIAAGKTEL